MMNWEDMDAQWALKAERGVRILSIDGGGTRGAFPAGYLARIEQELGSSIYSYFDLIAGTSTGGIIALALSLGISAERIRDLYVREGPKIFKPRTPLPDKVMAFFGSKYSNAALQEALARTLGSARMRDANTMLCIPSLEHQKAAPKVYKTPHDGRYHADAELPMWKVALATSAAPFYLPPFSVTGKDCKLDGGLWANNPVVVGIAEAVGHGVPLSKIKVLSLGTGLEVYSAGNEAARRNSILSWASGLNIVHLTMGAQSEGHLNTARFLVGDNLTRINFVARKPMGLDSTSKEFFDELLHEADRAFEKTFKNGVDVFGKFFSKKVSTSATA